MFQFQRLLITIAAVACLTSCSNTQQPVTPPITIPHDTVTIIGRVILAQSLTLRTPAFNGVTVSLKGTNFTTISNDSGYFTLAKVPIGTYTAHFSAPGFGDVRWIDIGVSDSAGDTVQWYGYDNVAILYRISNEVVTLKAVSDKLGYGYIIPSGTIIPNKSRPQTEDAVAIYFSRTSDVSAVPGHYAGFVYLPFGSLYQNSIDSVKESFSYAIDVVDPPVAAFKSGDSIYVAAYGAPYYEGWDYYDPAIKQYVLSAINPTPSRVVGTIVP